MKIVKIVRAILKVDEQKDTLYLLGTGNKEPLDVTMDNGCEEI
jgi:hypothetical protein